MLGGLKMKSRGVATFACSGAGAWDGALAGGRGRIQDSTPRKNAFRQSRHGFTLVELLAVIAIIGVLIALLLPAVQSAREAARRIQCANNFRQVGVAMHNYHATFQCFPPGSTWYKGVQPASCGPIPLAISYRGWGWGTFILPFVEQTQVYDMIDFKVGGHYYYESQNGCLNQAAAATRIPVFECPSDPQAGELVACSSAFQTGSDPDEDLPLSNMAGIADSYEHTCDGTYAIHFRLADGVMANLGACKARDISDGTGNTLMIGEVTGGGRGSFKGHFWVTRAIMDTGDGINGPTTLTGGLPAEDYSRSDVGPSSYHPGGCHFLLADGSVHFLAENIAYETLAALATRGGAETISEAF